MNGRPIIVTGVGGPAGRSVAGQLIDRGLDVIGVDMAEVKLPGVRTIHVPAADAPGFVPALVELATVFPPALIIPTVTEELVVLSRAGRAAGLPVVIATPPAITIANDKWLTGWRLAAGGVAVPRSTLAGGPAAPANIGWPLLSKPRVSRGARGVAVHSDYRAVLLGRLDDATLLQEFVPGTEYAVNLYRARSREHDVAVVAEKTALAGGDVGNGLSVRVVEDGEADDVAHLALSAVAAIGLSGPADVDIRRRTDGTPVVLEINARFGAHSALAPGVLDALLAERTTLASTVPA